MSAARDRLTETIRYSTLRHCGPGMAAAIADAVLEDGWHRDDMSAAPVDKVSRNGTPISRLLELIEQMEKRGGVKFTLDDRDVREVRAYDTVNLQPAITLADLKLLLKADYVMGEEG